MKGTLQPICRFLNVSLYITSFIYFWTSRKHVLIFLRSFACDLFSTIFWPLCDSQQTTNSFHQRVSSSKYLTYITSFFLLLWLDSSFQEGWQRNLYKNKFWLQGQMISTTVRQIRDKSIEYKIWQNFYILIFQGILCLNINQKLLG